jgi:hypothetical protein
MDLLLELFFATWTFIDLTIENTRRAIESPKIRTIGIENYQTVRRFPILIV